MYRYGNVVFTLFLLDIKKLEVAFPILCHKGILNKHLCKNFFEENRMHVFLWRFEYIRRRLNSNYRIDNIIVIMMKENNDIFLAGGDALVYLGSSI